MRFGYVITYVPDVAATVAFYTAAFGLQPRFIHDSGTYAELETGATALAFANEDFAAGNGHHFRPTRPDEPAPGIEIALVVDDVEAAYATACAAGAISAAAPKSMPWGQVVSYVRDCNGVLVELCSQVT